jgi:hypothetical protein
MSVAMPDYGFDELSSVTIGELGLGIMLLRGSDATLVRLTDAFAAYCRCPVELAQVRTLYARMIEREWIAPDPANADRITVTRYGHDLVLAAFTALIRLVDEGHGALEISLLFSLASRRLNDDDKE